MIHSFKAQSNQSNQSNQSIKTAVYLAHHRTALRYFLQPLAKKEQLLTKFCSVFYALISFRFDQIKKQGNWK